MRDDSEPRPTRPAQSCLAFDEPSDRIGVEHAPDAFPGSPGMLFKQAMAQTRMSICLTDPHLDDNPIAFANSAFRELTGYAPDEEHVRGDLLWNPEGFQAIVSIPLEG